MKRCFVILGLLLLSIGAVLAQGRDDQYVLIYNLIQEGDALSRSMQNAPALAKYREAQIALDRFQKGNPDWNTTVIKYRLEYLANRIRELSASAPGGTPPAEAQRTPVQPGPLQPTQDQLNQLQHQLGVLQDQVRSLQGDKGVLEAKLKEALSVQPRAESRDLAKAEEKVRGLQKENELLKSSLEQQKSALKGRLETLVPGDSNSTNVAITSKALEDTSRQLEQQRELARKLEVEKQALQAQLKGRGGDDQAIAALRAENELLKQRLATAPGSGAATNVPGGDLAQARAQIAALQSDREVLRLEKAALEQRVRQLSTPPTSETASAVVPEEPRRIRQLEREVATLQARLEDTKKELALRKAKAKPGRMQELQNEVTGLRTRLDVLEARKIPYTAEELALFSKPVVKLAETSTVKRSTRQFPPGSASLVAEAQRYFSSRQLDKAEEAYLQILKQDEKNPRTLANLASIQLERGRFDEAQKNAQQALADDPEDAFGLLVLGQIQLSQKQYDKAFESLSAAAKIDPQNADIQNYLGLALSEKGMRAAAETALRKAVQLRPGYADAHNNLAVVYLTQQPPLVELARWHYKKALSAGAPANPKLEQMLDTKEKGAPNQ